MEEQVDDFLENLTTHNFSVPTDDLKAAYQSLYENTSGFSKVTPDTISEAIKEDRKVVDDILRLSASFNSLDSWGDLLKAELDLERKSKSAIFNEIQSKIDDVGFKQSFFEFITDLLGEELTGGQKEFEHWDVVKTRYVVGKGSALRGQASGDWLEEKVETILNEIGLEEGEKYVQVGGRSEVKVAGESFVFEKGPDFVIPDLNDAKILIEAKAYVSSTGSKQTDVLGDITKLNELTSKGVKLFMVIDGPMWRRRVSDLREIFKKKEQGMIEEVYQIETLDLLKDQLETTLQEEGII